MNSLLVAVEARCHIQRKVAEYGSQNGGHKVQNPRSAFYALIRA
jgi:hypothetical protein